MEDARILSRALPSRSCWTYDEGLHACRAVMHGTVDPAAVQAAVPTKSVSSVARFIRHMHHIISMLVRPCGVCTTCDADFPAVLVAWFEACVDIGACPLFAPNRAARDSLRDDMAAAVVGSRGCRDARALAQRADRAYEAARAMIVARLTAGLTVARLNAHDFLGGLLMLPREEREALAAQLLGAP